MEMLPAEDVKWIWRSGIALPELVVVAKDLSDPLQYALKVAGGIVTCHTVRRFRSASV